MSHLVLRKTLDPLNKHGRIENKSSLYWETLTHRTLSVSLYTNDAWLAPAKICNHNCVQANYIIFPTGKLKYTVDCASRNQPEKKDALQIHRCEHQIASISRLQEWRPPSPAGIQRDCFSSKRKTNILFARKAAHRELKIETSFSHTHAKICS